MQIVGAALNGPMIPLIIAEDVCSMPMGRELIQWHKYGTRFPMVAAFMLDAILFRVRASRLIFDWQNVRV